MVALAARPARLGHVRFRCADRDTRDAHVEPAALGPAALGPNAAAVPHADLLADVHTEAHARRAPRGALRRSVEETEERTDFRLGDTDPLTGAGHAYAAAIRATTP